MARDKAKITVRQTRALVELLKSQPVVEAAKASGVSAASIYRWMAKDKDFQAALSNAQAGVIGSAISLLSGQARTAAEVLVEIAIDIENQPAVRVSAAKAILAELVKIKGDFEIQTRIAALEEIATNHLTDKDVDLPPRH